MRRHWLRAFFLVLIGCWCWAEELRLAQLSDIHAGGSGYSAAAFEQACQQALQQRAQAIILSGDLVDNKSSRQQFYGSLRHHLEDQQRLLGQFPGPIMLTLGNNDLATNYQCLPEDLQATRQAMLEAWGPRYYLDWLGNGVAPSNVGGFCWISLNSQWLTGQDSNGSAQAKLTLDWLECQLQVWKGPAVLLSHIPPSWDLYNGAPSWSLENLCRLQHILAQHPAQVIILAGHTHRNQIQALNPQRPVPILTAGALATKYGYLPNWRSHQWEVQPGHGVQSLKYQVHYPGSPQWDQAYQLDPNDLGQFLHRLRDDLNFYRNYVTDVYAHHPEALEWGEKHRPELLEQFWVQL